MWLFAHHFCENRKDHVSHVTLRRRSVPKAIGTARFAVGFTALSRR
jgi:hypothetical protein